MLSSIKYKLTIWQEMDSSLDGITSFQFSDDIKAIKKRLPELLKSPVLYFAVQESIEL